MKEVSGHIQFATKLVMEESRGNPRPIIPLVSSIKVTLESVAMPVI